MNFNKIITLTILFFGLHCLNGHGQEKVIDRNFNTWWTNLNRYQLTERWFFSSEVHIRRTEGLERWQQFLFRPAVNFNINEGMVATAGYTYILSYPYGSQPIAIATPENNIWEELTLNHQNGAFSISHRYRLEHRFIGKRVTNNEGETNIQGTRFAQRFRYRITANFSFGDDGPVFASAFNEVWIGLDKNNLMPSNLNQNWTYLGLGYQFTKRANVQLGYLHQILPKGDGVNFESNPTTQFTLGYHFGPLP